MEENPTGKQPLERSPMRLEDIPSYKRHEIKSWRIRMRATDKEYRIGCKL